MIRVDLPRASNFELLHGPSCEAVCIWEAGVISSTREARSLATHGCAGASSAPSPTMLALLTSLPKDDCSAVPRFEHGRLYLAGRDAAARRQVHELRHRARELGLSHLDEHGSVHVWLDTTDMLPVAAVLRLLGEGAAGRASLVGESARLSLRWKSGAYVATVRGASDEQARALRLLTSRPAVGCRGNVGSRLRLTEARAPFCGYG